MLDSKTIKVSDVLSSFLVLVLSFVVQFAVEYYNSERASVVYMEPIKPSGFDTAVGAIKITNFSKDYIDNLLLSIPADYQLSNITYNMPISLSDSNKSQSNVSDKRIVKVSQIPPKNTTLISFVVNNKAEWDLIALENPRSEGLVINNDLESPTKRNIQFVVFNSMIYALFFLLATYINRKLAAKAYQEVLDKADANMVKLNKMEASSDNAHKELASLRSLIAKQRMLLMSRISDAMKEVDFWRHTIRKILIDSGKDKNDADYLIDMVTKELKTFTTKGKPLSYESIMIAASIIENDSKTSGSS